jgi:hypothetical protein
MFNLITYLYLKPLAWWPVGKGTQPKQQLQGGGYCLFSRFGEGLLHQRSVGQICQLSWSGSQKGV